MTNALGLSTTAEGVETIAQASRLVELGCSSAQGYLYARPVEPRPHPRGLETMGIAQPGTSASCPATGSDR